MGYHLGFSSGSSSIDATELLADFTESNPLCCPYAT